MAYSPLALFIPPLLLVVHQQLNSFYQVWVHTEVLGSLGFLDLIINTPQHHQVHHGAY